MSRHRSSTRGLGFWAAVAIFSTRAHGDQVITHPFRGITAITRTETSPRPFTIHSAQIELAAAGIRFKLSGPRGTRDTVRQTTLDFLIQEQAQWAINAHFYLPFTTPDVNANLVGLAASEGIVFSPFEPQPIGSLYDDQSYAIISFAPALNIDRFNHASVVHPDLADPNNRKLLEPVDLWTAVAGSAQIISNGVKTIPTYTGAPGGLKPRLGYSDRLSWYGVLRARTAIGLTADHQTLVLFTVDEAGGSFGLTVNELADLLIRDYHLADALNLDGDGSTSMAGEDPVTHRCRLINVPSDGPRGRAVGSSLAVFAAPNSEPNKALTITLCAPYQAIISWPLATATWELESTSAPNQNPWYRVEVVPQPINGRWQITVPNSDPGGFFRLIRPPSRE